MKKYILVFSFIISILPTLKAQIRFSGLDADNKLVLVRNYYSDTTDLSTFYFKVDGVDYPFTSFNILFGWIKCPSNNLLGLTGVPLGKSGCISIHNSYWESTPGDQNGLCDFVQWNGNNACAAEDTAVAKGWWTKGDYVKSPPPIYYQGGCCDRGVSFWQVFKMPKVGMRFISVNPNNNQIAIRNTGASNLDVSSFSLCVDGTCYDSLKNSPWNIVRGTLDIPKNDTLVLDGVTLNPTAGSLALFLPLNFKDTTNLIDYIQWGSDVPTNYFDTLATLTGRWDTSQYVNIPIGDSTVYMGNYADTSYGAQYWKNSYERLGMVDLKLTKIDPSGSQIVFLNQGSIPIWRKDVVVYLNTDTLGLFNSKITNASIPDLMYPGDSAKFQVPFDITVNEVGLFRMNYNFDVSGMMDVASWGSNSTLAAIGIQKGIWDNTPISGNNTNIFTYVGDGSMAQRTSAFWQVSSLPNAVGRVASKRDINFYPNPSLGLIYFSGSLNNRVVDVFDLMGMKVFSQKLQVNSIDLSALAPGVYFISVPDIQVVEKVVVSY